jgi:betaine-aldehyde dehydrogenase
MEHRQPPRSATALDVVEPATEKLLAQVPVTAAAELDEIIGRAAAAQQVWRRTSPQEKARALRAMAEGIEADRERLAVLEARNVGMPVAEARGTVQGAADTFRYYSAGPERLTGETIPVAGGVDMTFHEPIGVVGVITPWNFPLTIASWKVAPALAAGNAVVLKPSELTPLTAIELERIGRAAGLPDGLFTVVNGDGATVGRALVDHPRIGKIGFTGSTTVGKEIARRAADRIARVTLELGGKSASIIFADADLQAAAEGLRGGVFGNSGQDCCARSRVLVERGALPEFLGLLETVVVQTVVGDPLDEATQMGPLVSAAQRARVQGYVDGAPVLLRGSAPAGPGYWFAPTVLHPIDDDHPAAREEIFGPVVSVLAFDTEDEAVDRANDTDYGLAGSIWTSDAMRSLRVAREINAGALAVNSYNSVRITTPFGGFKQSGTGRELGPHAVEAYTEVKNVFFATGPTPLR